MSEANTYSKELQFAKDLATEAARIAMSYFRRELTIKSKQDASPVTEADETINQLVIDSCRREYPDYGVLGEEGSWHLEMAWKWICDPIDGTADFVKGNPNFMFALSLDHDGKPHVAVAAHPISGDVYWAVAGQGAYKNDASIHVSDRAVADSTLVLPTNRAILDEHALMYATLTDACYATTHIHSSVYKGVKIADGTYDGAIWPGHVHPWDINAVKLIVEEAGGRVTDMQGQSYDRYNQTLQNGLIVSNKDVHPALVAVRA